LGRPLEPDKKARLRGAVADYVLAHGLADLSLRPLAKAVGSSARMLIYHFGSREALVREALEEIRDREDAHVKAWWDSEGARPRPLAAFIHAYWKRLSDPEAEPAARFLFEAYAMALRRPAEFGRFMEIPVAYWQGLLARASVPDGGDAELATIILAFMRGLLLDRLATGRSRRLDGAVDRFVAMLEAGPRPAVPRRRRPKKSRPRGRLRA